MISTPALAADVEATLPERKLLIGNRWVASESGRTFATLNPWTGDEICQLPKLTLPAWICLSERGARGVRALAVARNARVGAWTTSAMPRRSN